MILLAENFPPSSYIVGMAQAWLNPSIILRMFLMRAGATVNFSDQCKSLLIMNAGQHK